MVRWRGRRAGLAAALVTVAALAVVAAAARLDRRVPAVAVRDADGALLARIPLPDRRFAMRYRNSLYGTLAEERFVLSGTTEFRLVELAADQLAVLEEYYAVTSPAVRAPPGSRRAWRAEPARSATFDRLSVAATELGRRTLLVGDRSLALWRLVGTDPTVVLTVEGVQG